MAEKKSRGKSNVDWKNQSNEMIQDAFNKIHDITANFVQDPEKMVELLQFGSQFYHYSINNNILIYAQNRHASYVQSYQAWKEMGCSVLEGEKGIKIFVPVKATTLTLEDGSTIMLQDATKEQKEAMRRGEIKSTSRLHFKIGNVFDIGQTNFPKEKIPELYSMGYPSETHYGLYQGLKDFGRSIGYEVKDVNLESIALRGNCNHATKTININTWLDDTEKVSTLSHELGHALCTNSLKSESLAKHEFVADAVSVMIQSGFGIEIPDGRKTHMKNHYDKLKQEMEVQVGRNLTPDEMVDNINNILADTLSVYKEHIDDINRCVEVYVPQERLMEIEKEKQVREQMKDLEKHFEKNVEKDKKLELELEM